VSAQYICYNYDKNSYMLNHTNTAITGLLVYNYIYIYIYIYVVYLNKIKTKIWTKKKHVERIRAGIHLYI